MLDSKNCVYIGGTHYQLAYEHGQYIVYETHQEETGEIEVAVCIGSRNQCLEYLAAAADKEIESRMF